MACLVKSNGVLFLGRNDFGTLFQTSNDAVHSIQEILMRDEFSTFSCRKQGCFIADVGDVRTTESGGLLGQKLHVH